MANFKEILNSNLKSCKSSKFTDNYDFRRFGQKKFSIKNIKKLVSSSLISLGFYHFGSRQQIWNNIEKLAWLYERLDDESRNILVQVLSYRILGEKYVKLPVNTQEYWKKLEELDLLPSCGEKVKTGFLGRCLNKMNLESEGYPVEMFISPSGVYTQMILQHYRCQSSDSVIEVEKGDIAIDAGGCYGDTAINFSFKGGETCRVYSWEFVPENLDIFKRNMELNPEYAKRIELVENPLWSSSRKKLYVSGVGPGTIVNPTPPQNIDGSTVVRTYTIDDLRSDKDLETIDFIKMDIEGAELEALKGAVNTIRQFKPKLAISVYHNIKDFWEISQWIDSLELGYKFHLRHFTIHAEETVLFAEVKK